ncbi:hypothetical protein K438DRAFT_1763288 [Mycena galopus ATCC 62051]|nr:hypothetical protein K438DRAFT_1763288 [Mycena galopus ATCC 62051]
MLAANERERAGRREYLLNRKLAKVEPEHGQKKLGGTFSELKTVGTEKGSDLHAPGTGAAVAGVEGLALTVDGKKAKEQLSKFSITIEISNSDTSACAPDLRKWEGEYANIMNQHGTARYYTALHGTARHRCTVACTAVAYRALPWREPCKGVHYCVGSGSILNQPQ